MESQFKVIFTGKLKAGVERDTFLKDFSKHYQCSEEKAAELLDSGTEITMKRAVDRQSAEEYRDVMEGLGMVIRLEPVAEETGNTTTPPAATPAPAQSNPYQAPTAELHKPLSDGEMSGPVSVPFGHGMQWISEAYNNHFKGNAGAWIGTLIVWWLISVVMNLIPFIGMVVGSIINPIMLGGIMLGARAQDDGESFALNYLFAGFKKNAGQLALLGILYIVALIVIMVIAGLMMGSSMALLDPAADPEAMESMMASPAMVLVPMLVVFLLAIPMMMAYWFAPALIVLDDVSAMAALKLSFIGAIKNILPFTLYGIILIVLMFVAAIPLFLGYLVLFPVMMASMYTAYHDIYYPES